MSTYMPECQPLAARAFPRRAPTARYLHLEEHWHAALPQVDAIVTAFLNRSANPGSAAHNLLVLKVMDWFFAQPLPEAARRELCDERAVGEFLEPRVMQRVELLRRSG